jgi:uncharacterized integral membrane protein
MRPLNAAVSPADTGDMRAQLPLVLIPLPALVVGALVAAGVL